MQSIFTSVSFAKKSDSPDRGGNADNVFNKQIDEYTAIHGKKESIPNQKNKIDSFHKDSPVFLLSF